MHLLAIERERVQGRVVSAGPEGRLGYCGSRLIVDGFARPMDAQNIQLGALVDDTHDGLQHDGWLLQESGDAGWGMNGVLVPQVVEIKEL